MAGIGFELRKLFNEDDSFSGYLKAISFSTFISVGPFIITVLTLNILMITSKIFFDDQIERTFFITTLVYAFIISQLVSFPFQFFITRYISDRFYKKEYAMVKPSLVGISKIVMSISFIAGLLVTKGRGLPLYYNFLFIGLIICLSLLWTITTYISILKDYVYISKIYLYSSILTIIVFFITLKFPIPFSSHEIAGNMLFSFYIGIIVGLYLLTNYFFSIFKESEGSDYEFLKYIKNYWSLLFTGIFYIFGTWSHIIINWLSPMAEQYQYGLKTHNFYENAIFYSFLLTIPSLVFFVVFIETRFFDIHQKYYALILKNGTLEEIDKERKNMSKNLYKEILYALQVQVFITLTALLISRYFVIYHGLPVELVDIFKVVSLGAVASCYIIIIISVFFYLNQLMGAFKVTGVFFLLTTGISLFCMRLGEEYLGFGFFIGSVIALLYSLELLDKMLENLNYITFYSQNFALKKNKSMISKIIIKLDPKAHFQWSKKAFKVTIIISTILLVCFWYLFLK